MSKACVPNDQLCDLQDDCGDSSDEEAMECELTKQVKNSVQPLVLRERGEKKQIFHTLDTVQWKNPLAHSCSCGFCPQVIYPRKIKYLCIFVEFTVTNRKSIYA